MSRAPAKPRTALQQALVALRRHLGITQLQLALELNVTPGTTARWETTQPPRGRALEQIANFAERRGALVWTQTFRAALAEQRKDLRYQRRWNPIDDMHSYLEAAIRNVYMAVRTFGDDRRLVTYWANILEALIPAHRIVTHYASRQNAGVDELVTTGAFTPAEAQQMRDSIEGLRDLEHRLVDYRKEIAEQLKLINTKKRKPTK
jgi:transcriptional regulator with XRE-family HTH domain